MHLCVEFRRGNALSEKNAEGMHLVDKSGVATSVYRYRLALGDLQKLSQDDQVRLQLTLGSCSGVPLLRLTAWQGKRQVQYDVRMDCASGEVVIRAAKGTVVATLKREGGLVKLVAQYHMPNELDALEVSIYPSVSEGMGPYTASATGAVMARDVTWAIVPAHD